MITLKNNSKKCLQTNYGTNIDQSALMSQLIHVEVVKL